MRMQWNASISLDRDSSNALVVQAFILVGKRGALEISSALEEAPNYLIFI